MNKITLKKLYLNKDLIMYFNDGENYIIGMNNTGKTTFFNIIQYVLGVKKDAIKRLDKIEAIIEPYIECNFGSDLYRISRKIGSSDITFEGDINATVKAGSYELNSIYTKLLNIRFIEENNLNIDKDNSSLEIIKMSFLSEVELSKTYLHRGNKYYKILGINEEYLNLIKKDISNLKDEVKSEKKSLKMIEQYKESVESTIKSKEINNYVEVIQILKERFSEVSNNYLAKKKLLQNAENYYKDELTNLQDYTDEEISKLNPYFLKTIEEIYPTNNTPVEWDLKNVIEMKNIGKMSISQRIILLFALHITLCRSEIKNGLGVLITDNIFPFNDNLTIKRIRNKVSKVTRNGELQYIEFCTDSIYTPKESIVFEIPSKRGGGFFG